MRLCALAVAALALGATISASQDRDAVVYDPGGDVSLPRVVRQVGAAYTPEARAAGIEGTVMVEAVVLAKGTVGDVKVVKSLDTRFGLDQEAVNAARRWVFKPGTKDGTPVAVRVRIGLTFSLSAK